MSSLYAVNLLFLILAAIAINNCQGNPHIPEVWEVLNNPYIGFIETRPRLTVISSPRTLPSEQSQVSLHSWHYLNQYLNPTEFIITWCLSPGLCSYIHTYIHTYILILPIKPEEIL